MKDMYRRWLKLREHILSYKYTKIAFMFYGIVFPVLLFLALELINPAAQYGLMQAPWQNLGIILFSALFLALLAFVLFCFLGSVVLSYAVVSLIGLAVYTTNNLKVMVAGNVFVPQDLLIAADTLDMFSLDTIIIERMLILRIFIVLIIHLPLLFVKFDIKFKRRIIATPIAAAVFFMLFVSSFSLNNILPFFGVNNPEVGSLSIVYRDSGVALGFHGALIAQNAQNRALTPIAYTHFEENLEPNFIRLEDGVQPDVIVIMSEAFMDPTVIYNLYFSQDPAPNLRRLSQHHRSGNAVVPVFGGGTANTELEFLTGSLTFFTGPANFVPFEQTNQFFFREIQTALPWLFRDNGYRTIGVHPYYKTFWRRYHNYPLLGFDEFISKEDMPYGDIRGYFISDTYFTDRIIEQINIADEMGMPLFLYGISMENHWPYSYDRYHGLWQDVVVTSPLLDSIELGRVNSYVQGVFYADQELGRLVDFLEERGRPAMVVFFGDHLPIMGAHHDAVFERLGYITNQQVFNWTAEDRQKMFQVPYLVWTNYYTPESDWGTIGINFLGALVAQYAGLNLSRYYSFILQSFNEFRALTENHYVDIYSNFHELAGVSELAHIQAFAALQNTKWFGSDSFFLSLNELLINAGYYID